MTKIEKAFDLFDSYNQNAPERVSHGGIEYSSEYFYALKRYEWVKKLNPDADEPLLLASRSQHIGRWQIARKTYPDGRVGYLKWRSELAQFHAATSAEIMLSVGYDDETVNRVKEIILKQRLKTDEDVQTIENALCLVFLEFQYDELIEKLTEEKMVDVLRKTWGKMSDPGRDAALKLVYSDTGKVLLSKALGD